LIRIYAADIRQFSGCIEDFFSRISLERRQRIRTSKSEADKLRCLAAGLLLDTVLKKRAKTDISRGAYGKPMLPDGPCFNLSHAGDYALLAVSDQEIGADIERLRKADTSALAKRFYHPDEQTALAASTSPMELFFTIWALKESYIKNIGRGFSVSPASFAVLPSGVCDAVLEGDDSFHFKRYFDFPGYALALCAVEDEFPDGVTVLSYT
jgi:4'-phosphopantetheinyl transferase